MPIYFNGVKVIDNGGAGGGASWPGDATKLLAGDGSQITVGNGLQLSSNTLSSTLPQSSYVSTSSDSTVSLLLHMEGANNSTTFTDRSYTQKTITAYGNAKISTSAYKFGSASAAFDGNGDYLRTPHSNDYNFNTGDFTIEGWVNPSSVSSGMVIISKHMSAVAIDYEFGITNSTTITFSTTGPVITNRTVPAITTGTWHHFAITRSGSTIRMFWNGTQAGATFTQTISNTASLDVTIGCATTNVPSGFFNGYMDEIRFTRGTARYTSNFTPPASAFENADGTPDLSSSASIGETVYSNGGVYVYIGSGVWKKFTATPTTVTV